MRKKKSSRRFWRLIMRLAMLAALMITLVTSVFAFFVWKCSKELPTMDALYAYKPELTTRIVDRYGATIGDIGVIKRTQIGFASIPDLIINAVTAVEDARFFDHDGVDYSGLVRAMGANLKAGHFVQGGSTITQQVIKAFLLSPEKTLKRKVQEMQLAQQLEETLGHDLHGKKQAKQRVLELYLNRIFYGDRRYGIQEAALYYFGRNASDISDPTDPVDVSQAALLAGLPQNANLLEPHHNPAGALKRRRIVLTRMRAMKIITDETWQLANEQKLLLMANPAPKAPEVVDEVISWSLCQELKRATGQADQNIIVDDPECQKLQQQASEDMRKKAWLALSQKGTVIKTTISTRLERIVRTSIEEGIAKLDGAHPGAVKNGLQAAGVILTPEGEVLAVVGRNQYVSGNHDMAIREPRQPGSTFKPFVYAAAIDKKIITPATRIKDKEVCYKIWPGQPPWCPKNYEPEFEGWVTPRKALDMSINTVAAQVGSALGVPAMAAFASGAGIDADFTRAGPAMALGAISVTPLRLAVGYDALMNGGKRVSPYLITKVGTKDLPLPPLAQAMTPEVSASMVSLMRGVIEDPHGTGRAAAKLGIPMAGKTGTTSSGRDAWFAGFTPQIVLVVWVGYQDNRPLWRKATGASVALPIWMDIMSHVYSGKKVEEFRELPTAAYANIDLNTGVPSNQEGSVRQAFLPGTGFDTVPILGEPDPVETAAPAADTDEADDATPEETAPAEEAPAAEQKPQQ